MKIKGSSLFILILVLIGSSFVALDENFRFLNLISECSEEEDKTETEIEVHKSLFVRISRKDKNDKKRASRKIIAHQEFFAESVFFKSKTAIDQSVRYRELHELYILYCSLKLNIA